MAHPTLLITTLAEYQTRFWAEVGLALKSQGRRVAFMSFDDRSTEMLKHRGLEVHTPAYPLPTRIDDAAFERAVAPYDLDNVNHWLAHERVAFNLADSTALRSKLAAYLEFADGVIRPLQQDGNRVVQVQEVGGFLSVVAPYFAARLRGVDNWFIEPSFFRGRLFFTRNTFGAPAPARSSRPLTPEVDAYLKSTLQARQIVIPTKDKGHYTTPLTKVMNRYNALRLVQKVADKYLWGRHQEFGHIGSHVMTHLRMVRNGWHLRFHYQPLSRLGRFVYYPFHVPADMALTLRAPEYLDQLALVDYLARSVPHTHRLAIKEHPAMVGALDARRLVNLLKRYDNVALLPPTTNNYDVLSKAGLVVSVNSKSGAEALLTGTPVLALGDSFYRGSGLVNTAESLKAVPRVMAELLANPRPATDRGALESFLQGVWDATFPGELYVATSANADQFSASLLAAIGS